MFFTGTHCAYMEDDLPISFVAVSNVQILPGKIPSQKLVDAFQPAS